MHKVFMDRFDRMIDELNNYIFEENFLIWRIFTWNYRKYIISTWKTFCKYIQQLKNYRQQDVSIF